MQLVDVLALALLAASVAAFAMGEGALSRSEDLNALYWLVVGVVSLRGATQIAQPRAKV